MANELTEAEREAYRKDGYFVREAVFAEAELKPLRDAIEAIHRAISDAARRPGTPIERVDDKRYQDLLGSRVKWEWAERSGAIRSMEPFCHLDSRVEALVEDGRLRGPPRDLLECDEVGLFTDKLNYKRPGGAPFPWHQDTPYWQFGCDHLDQLVSLQLYLDEATAENGCLWIIPGSHGAGMLPCFQDRGVLGKLYTDVERLDAAEPVPIAVPAGSVIFFDGGVVHGSRTNRSGSDRRAIVLTYQPAGFPRWHQDPPLAEPL